MKYFVLLVVLVASVAFANNASEGLRATVPDEATGGVGPSWDGPLAELFNTGPWFNSAGTGVGGKDESILQDWGTTYGFGCQVANDNFLADDFEVPMGEQWIVNSITIAGYQTGSGTTPTIIGLHVTVYDDPPTTGMVVYGDYTTNIFTTAAWSDIYRVNEDGAGTNTDRPIMAVTADLASPWTFDEGTYWLGYQLDGTGSSGPWSPPVVIWDQPVTGNGLQSTDGGIIWEPILNGTAASGLCIILEGELSALENETWGSIKSIF